MTRSGDRSSESAVTLREFLITLNRRKGLIIAVAAPVFIAMALLSFTRTPTYTSQASVLVRCVLTNFQDFSRTCNVSATTETNVATSEAVASSAAASMGAASVGTEQLLQHVSVNMAEGTQVLTISFADRDPARAVQGAKAFATAYLSYREQQAQNSIQQRTDALTTALDEVGAEIRSLLDAIHGLPKGSADRADDQTKLTLLQSRSAAIQTGIVGLQSVTVDPGAIIDPPRLPRTPTSPRHKRDLAIGLVLGLMIGIGVALLRERNSDELRTAAEMERSLGAPVLASIPRTGPRVRHALVVADQPYAPAAAAYRRARIGLLGLAERSDLKTVLVTSPRMGEGKSATVANLGAGFAEIGKTVVMVSADLRRPSLESYFGIDRGSGLMDLASADTRPSEMIRETNVPGLYIVGSGSASQQIEPVNLLQADAMRDLLAECAARADIVLVDSPPVLGVPDALVLARLVDAVILLADPRRTTGGDVLVAREELERVGGQIVAGILNGVHVSHRDRDAYLNVRGMFGHTRVPRDGERALRRDVERTTPAGVDGVVARQVPKSPPEAHPDNDARASEEIPTPVRSERFAASASVGPSLAGRSGRTSLAVRRSQIRRPAPKKMREESVKTDELAAPPDSPEPDSVGPTAEPSDASGALAADSGGPTSNGSEGPTSNGSEREPKTDRRIVQEPRIGFRAASQSRRSRASVLRIDRPVGVRSGDVMIAALVIAGGTRVRTPSGWTEIQNETTSSGEIRLCVCYRMAASTEPPFYMWPTSGRQCIAGQIVAYSGVHASPIDASACRTNGRSTELRTPSIKTTAEEDLLVGIFGINANTDILPPDDMSERTHMSSGGDGEVSLQVADQAWGETGASGPRVATARHPGVYVGALIALRAG